MLHNTVLVCACFMISANEWCTCLLVIVSTALTTLSMRYNGGAHVIAKYPGHFDALAGFNGESEGA